MIRRGLELDDLVIAIQYCNMLNDQLNLKLKIEPFMIGQIVGFIDERVYHVMIEVFPKKKIFFKVIFNI